MNIFIAKDGAARGPYLPDQFKELIRRGEISMSDQAWFEGRSDWTPISQVPELLSILLPPLPEQAPPAVPEPRNNPQPPPIPPEALSGAPEVQSSAATSFWPKGWLMWTVVGLLGAPFLLLICLGGWFGFICALGVFVVAGLALGVQHIMKPTLGKSSNGYGKRHVVAGGIIVAGACLLTLFCLLLLADSSASGSGGGYVALLAILMMLSGGITLIKKGWQGIRSPQTASHAQAPNRASEQSLAPPPQGSHQ